VVFGLGIATILTLVVTPALLALRVWVGAGAYKSVKGLKALALGRESRSARDLALQRAARKVAAPEIIWDGDWSEAPAADADAAPPAPEDSKPLRAAE
jgi:multidrug efflux pump